MTIWQVPVTNKNIPATLFKVGSSILQITCDGYPVPHPVKISIEHAPNVSMIFHH